MLKHSSANKQPVDNRPFDIWACDIGPHLKNERDRSIGRKVDDSLTYSDSEVDASMLDYEGVTDEEISPTPKYSDYSPAQATVKSHPRCIGYLANDVVVFGQKGGFSSSKKLGSGAYGTAWKLKYFSGAVVPSPIVKAECQFKMNVAASFQDCTYVIKVINLSEDETLEDIKCMAQKEASILTTIYSEWKNNVFNVCNTHHAALIMPLQEGIDLEERMKAKKQIFSWRTSIAVALHLIDAVNHVCTKGFVHLDIRPANIMLDIVGEQVQQFRLIDFGIAEQVGEKISTYQEHDGTPYPHLPSDRKFIAQHENQDAQEDEKHFTHAASRHDYYAVGHVLEILLCATKASALASKDIQSIYDSSIGVRVHYNEVKNVAITRLTEVKTTFTQLLLRENSQVKAKELAAGHQCAPTYSV